MKPWPYALMTWNSIIKLDMRKKETRRELGSLYAQWKNRSSFCLIKRQKKLKKKKQD
jgi:hypothetical protein